MALPIGCSAVIFKAPGVDKVSVWLCVRDNGYIVIEWLVTEEDWLTKTTRRAIRNSRSRQFIDKLRTAIGCRPMGAQSCSMRYSDTVALWFNNPSRINLASIFLAGLKQPFRLVSRCCCCCSWHNKSAFSLIETLDTSSTFWKSARSRELLFLSLFKSRSFSTFDTSSLTPLSADNLTFCVS